MVITLVITQNFTKKETCLRFGKGGSKFVFVHPKSPFSYVFFLLALLTSDLCGRYTFRKDELKGVPDIQRKIFSELGPQEKGKGKHRGKNTKTQILEQTQSTRPSENSKCKWPRIKGDSVWVEGAACSETSCSGEIPLDSGTPCFKIRASERGEKP